MATNRPFEYELADRWYGSVETMNDVIDKCKKFIFALKSNRLVALSEADWQQGRQKLMSELEWEETTLHRVWLAEVPNALVLTRQTFLNKDGSRGELYLILGVAPLQLLRLTYRTSMAWAGQ